jgi:hypothetical protein
MIAGAGHIRSWADAPLHGPSQSKPVSSEEENTMQRTLTSIIALTLIANLVGPAVAALPDYVGFEIQARAAFSDAYNVPDGSSFASTIPSLNDSRKVAFAYTEPVNFDKQMWIGQGSVGAPLGPIESRVSTPHLNAGGDVVWAMDTFFGSTPNQGIWRAINDVPSLLTSGPASASDWDEPYVADNGLIGYRPEVFGAKRYTIYDPDANSFTTVAEEGANFGFLAQPAVNNGMQFGAHVWDATQGNVSQLRRFNPDGTSSVLFTEDATYNGIFNGVDINDGGQLAGQLFRVDGDSDLVRVDDNGVEVLASTALGGDFSDLALFDPKINNDGIVAFRGIPVGDSEGIYIADGVDLLRVVGIGDTLMTDLGEAQITSFANGWDINNAGDIVFNASISLVGGGSIGRGIFVAQVPEPATIGLLLMGGLVLIRRR